MTYVSNQPDRGTGIEPANTVFVEVDFPSTVTNEAERDAYVKVRSSGGDSLTLTGFGVGTDAFFRVITPGAVVPIREKDQPADPNVPVPALEALDGDTITLTAGQNILNLTVDGEGPVISDTAPAHGRLQDSSSTTIGFVVKDEGSGLRTEAEDAPNNGEDTDSDGSTAEPLTLTTPPGAAEDINVNWDGADNHEARGSRNWEEVEKDREYSLSYGLAALASDKYPWYVEAYDRVGNYTRTDSASKPGKQNFELTVDNQAPAVSKRFAGIGFDPDENDGQGGEVPDSSSILVVFVNEVEGAAVGSADALDSSTVDADDFVVVGNDVLSIIHPNKKMSIDKQKILTQEKYTVKASDEDLVDLDLVPDAVNEAGAIGNNVAIQVLQTDDTLVFAADTQTAVTLKAGDVLHNWPRPSDAAKDDTCESHTGFDEDDGRAIEPIEGNKYNTSDCINTTNRVYLVLSTPIGDNEEPEVQLRGGSVRDRAGNGSRSSEAKVANRIAPTLTVETAGDVATDGRPLAQEDITVDISSGERLLGNTVDVWLAEFDHDSKITTFETGGVVVESTTSWSVEFSANDETKVAAILLRGVDTDENVVTGAGWSGTVPEEGDSLNLAKLDAAGLLVEFDNSIPEAGVTLNPSVEGEPEQTESIHPFIELRFGEGKENPASYTVTEGTGDDEVTVTKTTNSYTTSKGVATKFDAYSRVELSDVTLDGEDLTAEVARVSSTGFDLALSGLLVGDHTLEFTATDTAGNSNTEEFDFEVLPRGAYEVGLRPGWNLVSFPGDPADTAIDSVLPADHPATDVLAYDAGLWTSAARGDGNVWEGDLTDIDGQHAYWINTSSTKAFEAVLIQPGIGSASRPPSIQLIAGWNLIPVTDLDQVDEGEDEAAQPDYFTSLSDDDFVVAYTYDARTRSWQRHVRWEILA